MTNCGSLTVSLYTGAPLAFLITTARDGDWASGGGPQTSRVAVLLYVVMLILVVGDGGPDISEICVTQCIYTCGRIYLYLVQ